MIQFRALSYNDKTKKIVDEAGRNVTVEPIGGPCSFESRERLQGITPPILRELQESAPEGATGVVIGSSRPYRFAQGTGPPIARSRALDRLEEGLEVYVAPVQYYKIC